MDYDFSSYQGKRVLVTGADGFMGSHLTERLLNLGAEVSVFVRGSSHVGTHVTELKHLGPVRDRLTVIAGDIAGPDAVSLLVEQQPAILFHLAADAYVPRSFTQPLAVCRTNIDGTLQVLEAGRLLHSSRGIERVVCTSSSEIYGSHPEPIKETDEMLPSSPYGASKAAADRLAYSYGFTFGLPVAIIRPFNTFGPRHSYDLVPKFLDLALEGRALTVYGNGTQTREQIYVSDTVDGFLLMGCHSAAVGQAVNFGTGHDVTVNHVASTVQSLARERLGKDVSITHVEARQAEVQRLCSDPTKAKTLFEWKARVSFEEGVRQNLQWLLTQKGG